MRDALREQADLIVRRGLVLAQFASREEIAATDEELNERVDELVEQASGGTTDLERRAQVRAMFDTEQMRASMSERLVTERALERLIEIASQQDEELEPRSPRRRGRRRRGARADDEADEADDEADEAGAAADEAEASEDASSEADAGDEDGSGDEGGDEKSES